MTGTGKAVRLGRILPNGRAVFVPFDDALINGPFGGLGDGLARVREAAAGGADGVMGFRGLLRRLSTRGIRVPFIANLTASTVRSAHTRKHLVTSVEAAVADGCDGVAAHVNVSARHEGQMLRTLGVIGEACDRWGMPLLAIMYPRREDLDGDDNYLLLKSADRRAYADLIAHAVRIGVELGADIVKTQYSGDPESFSTVIAAACGVPVVIAGGELVPVGQAIENARGAMLAGAAGVCFGRNTYNRTDPATFVSMLVSIVHHDDRTPSPLSAHTNASTSTTLAHGRSAPVQQMSIGRGDR